MYFKFLFFILLCFSCSNFEIENHRVPNSFISRNYTCSKILSSFFVNPYKIEYKLQNFSYDDAVSEFTKNLKLRSNNLKEGSKPFMMLQRSSQEGPTVVLLHGYSDSAGSMKELATMYYDKGFNVVAPLYRDHGLKTEFQKQALENSSLDDWREDVDFALSVAKGLSGGQKVHIGGYSMGATLAMDLSRRFPNLVASRTLYAPLFKENGFVIQPAILLLNIFTNGSFFKSIEETDVFYKRMTYRQTAEMHRLTKQIQPYLLKKSDDIPTAVFRVDERSEKTVDNKFIDKVVKIYGFEDDHHIFVNKDLENPVLHRDFTASNINSNNKMNPALEYIEEKLHKFLEKLQE